MSQNKNAIIRYNTLNKCFRNPGRNYAIDDLLDECNKALADENPNTDGIKRRQLFVDIKFMESENGWSIDLERIPFGKKNHYRYEDMGFSISNQPINEIEAEQIKSAMMILSRFKGMPQFNWVEEIIPKLEQAFGTKSIEKEIISFDSNQYLKGVEHLGTLFNAILYKKVIEVEYQSFKSEKPNNSQIHPYYLKQYNNRWFLFGKSKQFETLTTFSLDRIISISEVDEEYIENAEYNFTEYFDDVIGITIPIDTNIELIKLQFSTKQAPYIITKPLHGSQKNKPIDENGVLITIEVIPNYELKSLLLSFGKEVNVISPTWLKDEIISLAYC